MSGRLRVGIGGWTFPPWRGLFYPPGLPQARELEFASRQLGVIEINATFYGRQSPASWRKWAAAVPDDFKFAVKGSRFCVSRPRLADAGEGVAAFLAQGLVELGSKLGPILWMLSPSRPFDEADIGAFLALLPSGYGGLPLRHAIEPRHPSFANDRFFDLCRRHDVAVVLTDHDEFPRIDVRTASFRYARLQCMRDEMQTGYSLSELDRWSEEVMQWAKEGDAYVFMINGAKRRAPAAALEMQNRCASTLFG